MKLTKSKLRQIIREELLNEGKKMTKTDYRKFRMDIGNQQINLRDH